MSTIFIEGMQFLAYHGCHKEEKIIGNYFEVNVSIDYDTSAVENSDDLENTINYQSVYKLVKAEMEIASKTIEHVGYRILNSIYKEFPAVKNVKVKVSKLNPMLLSGGVVDKVSIELQR